jgi:hypothetical protein
VHGSQERSSTTLVCPSLNLSLRVNSPLVYTVITIPKFQSSTHFTGLYIPGSQNLMHSITGVAMLNILQYHHNLKADENHLAANEAKFIIIVYIRHLSHCRQHHFEVN